MIHDDLCKAHVPQAGYKCSESESAYPYGIYMVHPASRLSLQVTKQRPGGQGFESQCRQQWRWAEIARSPWVPASVGEGVKLIGLWPSNKPTWLGIGTLNHFLSFFLW